jgi:hypothetical protein
MVIKFNPEGRVAMVLGRKQEASDEGTEPLRHPKPPLPAVDGMGTEVNSGSESLVEIKSPSRHWNSYVALRV